VLTCYGNKTESRNVISLPLPHEAVVLEEILEL
jgi:hypothetical protein